MRISIRGAHLNSAPSQICADLCTSIHEFDNFIGSFVYAPCGPVHETRKRHARESRVAWMQ